MRQKKNGRTLVRSGSALFCIRLTEYRFCGNLYGTVIDNVLKLATPPFDWACTMTWPVKGFAAPPPPLVPPPLVPPPEVPPPLEVLLVDPPPQEIRPTAKTRTRVMTARPRANGIGVRRRLAAIIPDRISARAAKTMPKAVFRCRPTGPSQPRGLVRIDEPVGLAPTVTVSVVLPGTALDVGLNVQVIPVGAPGHEKVTFPLKPLLEFKFNVKLAELCTAIVADVGDTEALIVPTTSVAGFELVIAPLVPVTVNGELPTAALLCVLTVRVEVELDVGGLNAHVAPAGKPLQLKVTAWLKPLVGVICTVYVADPPASALAEDAVRAMVNAGGIGVAKSISAIALPLAWFTQAMSGVEVASTPI